MYGVGDVQASFMRNVIYPATESHRTGEIFRDAIESFQGVDGI